MLVEIAAYCLGCYIHYIAGHAEISEGVLLKTIVQNVQKRVLT